MRPLDFIAGGLIALGVSAAFALPTFSALEGLSIDALVWLRDKSFGPRYDPAASPSVVIALDEETYRTPPFADIPNALWTPQIAAVLNAVIEGGAKVVGLDVIFPTSPERFVRDFDRDFLLALRDGARAGKIVLGKVQHQRFPIRPFPGQSFAVGHQQNIRSVNVFRDDDEVIRRVPLTFQSEDGQGGLRAETSMALELAARAAGARPETAADGGMSLAGYRIAGSASNNMALNFEGGSRDIPTYALADLFACAEQGQGDYFRAHFAGKVVLLGVVLDVEDRLLTSKRFATGAEGMASGPRCALPPMEGLFHADLVRDTIPGVYVHATAVNNLLRGDALRELDRLAYWAIGAAFSLAAAAAAVLLAPNLAGAALIIGGLLWTGTATAAFYHGLVLPLLDPLLSAALAVAILFGYRFTIADHDKRLLRNSFALYLAPAVVDRLIAAERPPTLGGESRVLTVLFSDIEDFTTLSEGLTSAALVALMNEYLSAMTDIVETHGGFVDKYIGDAIVAVFGAPHDDPEHAANGVRAALACKRSLMELNRDSPRFRGRPVAARIGINTGEMLVGNIGSRRRFNYTVMGDAVNLAARLEGVNKVYGTRLLATDATVRQAGPGIVWREIDQVRVKGRDRPVALFEPLSDTENATPAQAGMAANYAAGLAAYRARRFADAAAEFEKIPDDPPARYFAARSRQLAVVPLPADWEPVNTLESK